MLLLAALALCAACSGSLAKIAPEPPAGYTTTKIGSGSSCGMNLFGLIPLGVNGRAQRAYDAALKGAGGSGLTDVKVTERWYWVYVGNVYCTDVEGLGFATR
jgi:hypothetical protein